MWRKHKARSAMPLFTLCVLGAVDAIMRYGLLAGAQGQLLQRFGAFERAVLRNMRSL